jgi:peptidoglycan hydrolase-like protein with peptidoglycan-binding domain
MRIVGAALVVLLCALPAAAQTDNPPSAAGARTATHAPTHKFRRHGARTASILRARAVARRAQIAAQHADTTPAAAATAEGTSRFAAARRRGPAPSSTPRDNSRVSLADRTAIQFELAWAGEYTGLINGEFNDKTVAAIRAYQRNRKFKETGVLNTQERALLAASAKAKQAQVGWTMVEDTVTGARLGLPSKQAPNKSPGKSGTRWSSAQGQVQVETFRIRGPGTTLAAVFEQQKKEPSTRKIENSLLRPDLFILSGTQGLKKFTVRADIKDGEVRGMTLLYDQATETIMDPVAVVMAGAFTAFPGAADVVAQSGPPARRKVEYGTGIVVSAAGHIITDRQVTDGCNVIVVSGYGDADKQAQDQAADLALIRVYGVPDLVPAAFAGDTSKNPDLTLIGIADPQTQGGASAITTVAAKLRGDAIEPAPQLGFSGAGVLDAQGHFAGMIELKTPVVAAVGAAGTQPHASMVTASAIRAFLENEKLPPASARTGVEAATASIVRVICVRK